MAAASAIQDYAMIGDCRTAAIISKQGSIDWLCLPDFCSPSLFARLLDDEKGGYFAIGIQDATAVSRRYLPDTAVLETTIESKHGAIRLTDCMPVLHDMRHQPELQPMREILRKVEVLRGNPAIEVHLEAKPNYASRKAQFYSRGKLGWALCERHYLLNLLSSFPLAQQESVLRGVHTGTPGETFWLSLTFEEHSPGVLMPLSESQSRLDATIDWWKNWSSQCEYQGEWRDQVVRSAIMLRLLTFTQSGAVLAAATTSLPERAQGWMNWDYRYCWPRDSAVALSAFMHLGIQKEAQAFFDWLMIATNTTRPRLSNIYDIYGRQNIKERLVDTLSGYHGAKPVRVGNAVSKQMQHDVYGEVMMAIKNWLHHFGKLGAAERSLIESFGKVVAGIWREPDNGIWELRDQKRHYTYSKVMAWYVFDNLIHLHNQGLIDGPLEHYTSERQLLRDAIESRAYNQTRNCFTATFEGDTLDASLLLMPRCGFVAYDDPRMTGTWQAIREDLEINGLILRYPPGFAGSQPGEGAFIICNFWAVNYLTGCGRHNEARERFTQLIALANDVGLYSEGVDVDSRAMLGNLPQAFSHAGLINAAVHLGDAANFTREDR